MHYGIQSLKANVKATLTRIFPFTLRTFASHLVGINLNALSVGIQIFATLHYLATGSFQEDNAYLHVISTPSVYRCTVWCMQFARHFATMLTSGRYTPNETIWVVWHSKCDETLIPIKIPKIDVLILICIICYWHLLKCNILNGRSSTTY